MKKIFYMVLMSMLPSTYLLGSDLFDNDTQLNPYLATNTYKDDPVIAAMQKEFLELSKKGLTLSSNNILLMKNFIALEAKCTNQVLPIESQLSESELEQHKEVEKQFMINSLEEKKINNRMNDIANCESQYIASLFVEEGFDRYFKGKSFSDTEVMHYMQGQSRGKNNEDFYAPFWDFIDSQAIKKNMKKNVDLLRAVRATKPSPFDLLMSR